MLTILAHALELFCCSLALHIFVWRMFPVKSEAVRLIAVFTFGALATFGVIVALSSEPFDWLPWMLSFLLHFALAGAYMCLYTGVNAFSPTIGIAKRVEASMPKGLPRDQLAPPWFTDAKLSGARRDHLLSGGLVMESEGMLRLTPRGRQLVWGFLTFRRLLGLPDLGKG
jgi:predicted permease